MDKVAALQRKDGMSGEIVFNNIDDLADFVAAFHKTGCKAWFSAAPRNGEWVLKFEAA